MTGPGPWLIDRIAVVAGGGAAAEIVATALQQAGAQVAQCKVAHDHASAAASLDSAARQFAGSVSILVHAAQAPALGPAHLADADAWRNVLAEDLDSRFFYSAALARSCIAAGQRAAILFLALPPDTGGAAHAASHGALQSLVKTLSVEWARDGIRVNAIVSKHAVAPRGAEAASLGNFAAYLCSDYAAYITGALSGLNEANLRG